MTCKCAVCILRRYLVCHTENAKKFQFQFLLLIGIAFPTCVSLNNCVCHFSPLRSDALVKLKKDDVVKMYVICDPMTSFVTL